MLMARMKGSFDTDMYLAGGLISEPAKSIDRAEWQRVASAGAKRQREYACGRYYSHQLLQQIGFGELVIGSDAKGCPQWPTGIVGSISHTNDYCVAMLARTENYVSVGADLEEAGRMKESLWPRLFTPVEIERISRVEEADEQMRLAAILFSAKEAFYKCDYPLNQQSYEFTDVEVSIDDARRLSLIFSADDRLIPYQGCYVSGMTHIMTVVYLSNQFD